MTKFLLVALALLFASPVAAQTIGGCGTTAIPKADLNSIPKLQIGIDCRVKAKGLADDGIKLRTARIAAITPKPVPTPAPTPTPTPTPIPVAALHGVVAEGDSISAFWPGSYTGIYARTHPTVEYRGTAVGGSGIDSPGANGLVQRLAADLALSPAVVTVLIGTNDLAGAASAQAWLDSLWSYVAALKASGAKVVVGTVLPFYFANNASYTATHNSRRAVVNAAIRAAVGTRIDAVVDFAADPVMGPDSAARDPSLYSDGAHPSDASVVSGGLDGGSRLAAIYAPVLDRVLAQPATVPTMPMPMPTGPDPKAFVPVPSPSLAGVAPIASGVDVAANLWKAWGTGDIPASDPNSEDGAFRFLCAPSHNAYDDPIVYPGQAGKSHLHTFFGNTLANAGSTYASLRTTGESSCNNLLNRSAYWIAAMMHPSGKVVMPDYISIYYKRPPVTSPSCKPPVSQGCLALPRGLRYIFGYNMTDPTKNDPAIFRWFNCVGDGAVSGAFPTMKAAAAGCPVGARLGMILVGPNCWNGKDLDSPDHRSHMAYTSYGDSGQARCPATHPYLVPFFETASWYLNDGTLAQWKLSSDIQMGTEAGVTAHADWWGAWEDSIKDRWTANCIDKGMSCSGADLGDGFMLAALAKYPPPSDKPMLVDPPARAMVH